MTHHFDVVAEPDVFLENGASHAPWVGLVCHSRAPQHRADGMAPAPLDTCGWPGAPFRPLHRG